jgi:NAD(P)-dependent dehydrogenase (short-subunit alcohol dehydrogenase family)
MSGVDLSGKTAIVTGGYSGLGLEMTGQLARAGASVVVLGRSREKAERALQGMAAVKFQEVDLADPVAVERFAAAFLASEQKLDLLIHSAGIMASPLGRDPSGNELQFAVNHLAPFRLTNGLLPALRASSHARVVTMSSRAHRLAGVDFDDPNFLSRAYDPWIAYAQSKSATALFALCLDKRGEPDGIRAFSVHPGAILTDLARHLTHEQVASFGAFDDDGQVRIDPERDLKSVQQGAATALWCATNSALDHVGGVYCENCDVAPLREADDVRTDGVRKWAADEELAERLWSLSDQLTSASHAS